MAINKEEIVSIRKKLNLSQHGLGKKLGVSKTTVSNWENGIHPMGLAEEKVLRILLKEHIEESPKDEYMKSDQQDLLKEMIDLQKKYINKLEQELESVKKQNIFLVGHGKEGGQNRGAEGD